MTQLIMKEISKKYPLCAPVDGFLDPSPPMLAQLQWAGLRSRSDSFPVWHLVTLHGRV